MTAPYYSDDSVTLYLGDYRDRTAGIVADAIITDPPYGETSLEWDRWPMAWPEDAAKMTNALWCFGSFRMFMDNLADFDGWKFSHEIVWQKQNGSGFATDKFRRVHELATFWYRGPWSELRHEVPRVPKQHSLDKSSNRTVQSEHTGHLRSQPYIDDGLRLNPSVMVVPNEQSRAVHPTQKPLGIISPLVQYSVPVGGLVVDLFAGSGTTLLAAKLSGRRAIGFEVNEKYAEAAARRLAQQTFALEGIA